MEHIEVHNYEKNHVKNNKEVPKNGKRRNRNRDHAYSRLRGSKIEPRTCEIEVSKKCNLRCIHCYASAGLASKNEITTSEIIGLLDKNPSIKKVIITGGEPFLKKDIMELLETISVREINIGINTNGVLLKENCIRRLVAIGVKDVQISLDGLEKTHEKIRGVKGCFNKAVQAVKLCCSMGLRVEIGTVLNKLNKDEIVDLLKFCKKLGIKKFSVDLYIPAGRAVDKRLAISLDEYAKIINKITDVTKIPPQKYLLPKCGVGYNKIVVTATGEIIPCVAMPDLVMGNIRTDDLRTIMQNSPLLKAVRSVGKINACASCKSKMVCCGGCRARAYAISGKILSPDLAHCRLYGKKK